MKKKTRSLLFLIVLIFNFLFTDLFASTCKEYFSNSMIKLPVTISITQPGSLKNEYLDGICNQDAAEILYIMRSMPHSFDTKKIRVLVLGNVFVNDRTWRSHVAVYDGKGYVYDAAVKASREIQPVTLHEYVDATMNKLGHYTEVRIIDPNEYLVEFEHSRRLFWTLLYFGYGMEALGVYQFSAFQSDYIGYRADPPTPNARDLLPPILKPQDLFRLLNL